MIVLVLPTRGCACLRAAAAAAVAARESQDDESSLRAGRCGRFLVADCQKAMCDLFLLWQIDDKPQLVLAACGVELDQRTAVMVVRQRSESGLCWPLSLTFPPHGGGSAAAVAAEAAVVEGEEVVAPHDTLVAQTWEESLFWYQQYEWR